MKAGIPAGGISLLMDRGNWTACSGRTLVGLVAALIASGKNWPNLPDEVLSFFSRGDLAKPGSWFEEMVMKTIVERINSSLIFEKPYQADGQQICYHQMPVWVARWKDPSAQERLPSEVLRFWLSIVAYPFLRPTLEAKKDIPGAAMLGMETLSGQVIKPEENHFYGLFTSEKERLSGSFIPSLRHPDQVFKYRTDLISVMRGSNTGQPKKYRFSQTWLVTQPQRTDSCRLEIPIVFIPRPELIQPKRRQ